MRYQKPLLVLALSLFIPFSLFAEEWVIPRTTYYITAEQQKFPDFPAPPAAGSRGDLRDFAVLKDWQHKRTKEQCDKANAGAHAAYEEFFGDISPFPSPLPEAAAVIFKRVKTETDGAAADIKEMFKRQRPFLRDASLEPCLGRIGGLAYPSGHATISRLFALMLADLAPSRKKEFFARADEAGLYRVIGGVHHPSDIAAGKKLADKLYKVYLRSPAFRADLETLRSLLVKEGAAR
jgi:acid phosphatase (class A)